MRTKIFYSLVVFVFVAGAADAADGEGSVAVTNSVLSGVIGIVMAENRFDVPFHLLSRVLPVFLHCGKITLFDVVAAAVADNDAYRVVSLHQTVY